jgi:hypothetical protein
VKFSRFPAELLRLAPCEWRNRWLQWHSMRIELPIPSWADTVQRAEEDAHTLTIPVPSTSGWMPLAGLDPAEDGTWRAEIGTADHRVLTLTL